MINIKKQTYSKNIGIYKRLAKNRLGKIYEVYALDGMTITYFIKKLKIKNFKPKKIFDYKNKRIIIQF